MQINILFIFNAQKQKSIFSKEPKNTGIFSGIELNGGMSTLTPSAETMSIVGLSLTTILMGRLS